MHLYIHGFGSSSHSYKARLLAERAAERGLDFACPDLPHVPDLAMSTLRQWCELTRPDVLIGSSLGGFYARCLANQFQIPAVLVNPALDPGVRLREAIGHAQHYYDQSYFQWTERHCQALSDMQETGDDQRRLWLLTQLGDEVLDAQEAINQLPDAYHTIEMGGDHSFQGFERHLDAVLDWRGTILP